MILNTFLQRPQTRSKVPVVPERYPRCPRWRKRSIRQEWAHRNRLEPGRTVPWGIVGCIAGRDRQSVPQPLLGIGGPPVRPDRSPAVIPVNRRVFENRLGPAFSPSTPVAWTHTDGRFFRDVRTDGKVDAGVLRRWRQLEIGSPFMVENGSRLGPPGHRQRG